MLPGVEELVSRSLAIGSDPRLVVHGGGNTSCKTVGPDHLGRTRPLLVIKASGADLASIDDRGFVVLYLDDLLAAREQNAMDDEAMTRFLLASIAGPTARRPSIETLLHAFLPAAHVDHVHADAICALTNGPRPAETVRAALGSRVVYIPYQRPGFALAREVAVHADAEAIVLGHHGLVTWSETSGAALDRMREVVARADRFLGARELPARTPSTALGADEAERVLLALRGRLSRNGRRVLWVDRLGREIAERADAAAILAAGPATADHLLRIRPHPILVRSAGDVDAAVDQAERRAGELWEQHHERAAPGTAMRDPRPVLAMVPGLGVVASGGDATEARIVTEVAAHSHAVAATVLDVFGEASALSDADIFDLEYWPLELAKLKHVAGRDLDGRVIVVTGAASGIGRDVALALARLGAHVTLTDVDEVGITMVAETIRTSGGHALAIGGDVTKQADIDAVVRETILHWGGVDGAVSNAGVAVTGRIGSLSTADWERSLAVNATSHFLLARRLLPVLTEQGLGGALVFVASKNAFSPGDGFGAYSVAKAAEVQLARIVAIEGGRSGIRANVVSPDAVFEGSRLWDAGLREERAAAHGVAADDLPRFYAARSLLGVPVRGIDVAEAVAFCLSDRSSRMTGCVLTVDAGVAAAFPR
jgi:rhamnulose-1-phosphate aldolase/alcohol dehydrogenase